MGSSRTFDTTGEPVSDDSPIVMGIWGPPHPHPLLAPEKNEGWGKLRAAYDRLRERIEESEADAIIVYSTTWPSVIGHQVQCRENPEWTHVDDDFHALGSMPYSFKVDVDLAKGIVEAGEKRGLHMRGVDYRGFPIDTGSIVALSLLNPDNRLPMTILSSNMYANRAETIVLGKATTDVLKAQGKKAVAVVVASLSNRMFTKHIEPQDDRIHSQKDDEWNRKILEFFAKGRLEDISQLSRDIHSQIRVQKVVAFKPAWWLASTMGQHNRYEGEVLAYEALHGSGGAVISLTPTKGSVGDKEFDEDDVEYYRGDRNVIDSDSSTEVSDTESANSEASTPSHTVPEGAIIETSAAPKAVGAYPHARRVGELLYLSGVGPRQAGTDEIPGGAIRTPEGIPQEYDIKAQTEACIANVKAILEASGASLSDVIDITSFLVDMERDFSGYNEVYAEHFTSIQATRTTLAITALPTPIAVEMKVIARIG